ALASEWLGKPVRLARAPRGAVVYGAALPIITTASLRELADSSGHPRLLDEAARFRAAVVLGTDGPFIEEAWQGRAVTVRESQSDGRQIRIGEPIPRCAAIGLDPASGARGSHLLKALAATRPRNSDGDPHFGVYAEVIEPAATSVP